MRQQVFVLSFIIETKGEFEPREQNCPMLAINTIENLARISLIRIALNKSNPFVKRNVMINQLDTIQLQQFQKNLQKDPSSQIVFFLWFL